MTKSTEDEFDKAFKKFGRTVGALWLASFFAGLVLTGVMIWGIIALILHFT